MPPISGAMRGMITKGNRKLAIILPILVIATIIINLNKGTSYKLDKRDEIGVSLLSNISFSSRITGGDENLYTNIIMDNPLNKKVIDMYLKTSNEIFDLIKNNSYNEFKKNFVDNRKYLKNHISKMIDQSDFLVDKMAEFKSSQAPRKRTNKKP